MRHKISVTKGYKWFGVDFGGEVEGVPRGPGALFEQFVRVGVLVPGCKYLFLLVVGGVWGSGYVGVVVSEGSADPGGPAPISVP